MRHAPLLVLLLSWTTALSAEDVPELIRLRDSYKGAVEKATKPIRQTYVAELVKLRDALKRSAKLEAANGVQAEIDIVSQDDKYVNTSKGPDPRWFVGKAWGTSQGTDPRWVFAKEGKTGEKWKGPTIKVASFTWMVLESGVIEMTEQVTPGGPSSKSYIRFKDRDEAWIGVQPETQETRLYVR